MRSPTIPALTAALLLAAALTGCSTTPTPAPTPTPTPTASASAGRVVRVVVEGSGVATGVTVTVTGLDGSEAQSGQRQSSETNVALPYATTLTVPEGAEVSVSAQNGTSSGPITARVEPEGGQAVEESQSGSFAVVAATEGGE